jgi:uncharacterized membrane protein
MLDFLAPAGKYLVPYTSEIAVAFITSLLVILGGNINQMLRNLIGRRHFVIRTLAFILLNAFGYGLFIIKVSPYLSLWLRNLDHAILVLIVIISFLAIGIWAQKNRHV